MITARIEYEDRQYYEQGFMVLNTIVAGYGGDTKAMDFIMDGLKKYAKEQQETEEFDPNVIAKLYRIPLQDVVKRLKAGWKPKAKLVR